MGLDLSSHADDEAALRYLVQTMKGLDGTQARLKELEAMAPYAQAYAQHGDAFRKWLATQQGAAKPQDGQKKFWDPPEFDPSWLQFLERDPTTGEIKLKAGSSPDILPKYQAWDQYRRSFGDRLLSNPAETLTPLIEEVARRVTDQYYNQNMGKYQESSFVAQFENEHAGWLFQKDANGRPAMDGLGKPIFTPEGDRFVAYANQAKEMGISDVRQRFNYARDMLSRDLALAQGTNGAAAQTQAGEEKKKTFVQNAQKRTPNATGPTQPPSANPDRNVSANKDTPLIDRLRGNLKKGGVTDADLGVPEAAAT